MKEAGDMNENFRILYSKLSFFNKKKKKKILT